MKRVDSQKDEFRNETQVDSRQSTNNSTAPIVATPCVSGRSPWWMSNGPNASAKKQFKKHEDNNKKGNGIKANFQGIIWVSYKDRGNGFGDLIAEVQEWSPYAPVENTNVCEPHSDAFNVNLSRRERLGGCARQRRSDSRPSRG